MKKFDLKGRLSKKELIYAVVLIVIAVLCIGGFFVLRHMIKKNVVDNSNSIANEIRIRSYDDIGGTAESDILVGNADKTTAFGMGEIQAVLNDNKIVLSGSEESDMRKVLSTDIQSLFDNGLIGKNDVVYPMSDKGILEKTAVTGSGVETADSDTLSPLSKAYIANACADAAVSVKPDIDKKDRVDAGTVSFKTILDMSSVVSSYDDTGKKLDLSDSDLKKIAKKLGIDFSKDAESSEEDALKKQSAAADTAMTAQNTDVSYDDTDLKNKIKKTQSELETLDRRVDTLAESGSRGRAGTRIKKDSVQSQLDALKRAQARGKRYHATDDRNINKLFGAVNDLIRSYNALDTSKQTVKIKQTSAKGLTKVYDSRLKKIDFLIKKADRNSKNINILYDNQKIELKAINRNAKAIAKLEDDMDLSGISSVIASYQAEADKAIKKYESDTDSRFASLERQIKNNKSSTDAEFEYLKSLIDAKSSDVNSVIESTTNVLDQTISQNKSEMENTINDLKLSLEFAMASDREDNASARDALYEKLLAVINKNASDTASVISNLYTTLNQAITDNRQAVDKRITEVSTNLNTKIDNNKSETDKQINNIYLEIKKDQDAVKKYITTLNVLMNEKKADTDQKIKETTDKISDLQAKINDKFEELYDAAGDGDTDIWSKVSYLSKNQQDIGNDIRNLYASLKEYGTKTDQRVDDIYVELNKKQQDVNTAINDIYDSITQDIDALEKETQELRGDVNIRFGVVNDDLPVVIDGNDKSIAYGTGKIVVTNDAFKTVSTTDESQRTTTTSKCSGVTVNFVHPYGIVPQYTVDDTGTLTITFAKPPEDVRIKNIIVYRKYSVKKN